LWIGDLGEG